MMTLMEFSERLYEATRERGMTFRELARRLGISEWLVYRWSGGRSDPGLLRFLQVCEVLEMTPDELLGMRREEE